MPQYCKSVAVSTLLLVGLAPAAHAGPFDRDGTYVGAMELMAVAVNDTVPHGNCVQARPLNLTIARGVATVSYSDWGRNIIHFRGKLDPSGNIQLWHTNGDGTRSLLIGQIGDGGFSGYMARDNNLCPYKVTIPIQEPAAATR